MIFIFCAQTGILSVGVKIPLIRIKTNIKKKDINITCCCVDEMVETNNPIPKTTNKYTTEKPNSKGKLPTIGISNRILPRNNPNASSNKAMIRKGINFPMMNSNFRIGVTFNCSMVPISFSRTMFMAAKNMLTTVTKITRIPGTI